MPMGTKGLTELCILIPLVVSVDFKPRISE